MDELRPEIVNVHNIHGALAAGWGPGMVAEFAKVAPVVWTLHDMWSFTGRCAYAGDCGLFRSGCDHTCPTADEYPALSPSRIRGSWETKSRVVSGFDTVVAVTPSRWLKERASEGFWPAEKVYHIANGIPLDRYLPIDQTIARSALGIQTSKPIILVGAADWSERRKGAGTIVEALDRLPPASVCLLTMGRGRVDTTAQEVHELGYVDHDRTMALAYSSADFLVHAAQSDNLPNVVVESVACGTPVVGLPVGGVPEIVVTGVTGWLAEGHGATDLADAITMALADRHDWQRLRTSCRRYAEDHFDARRQVACYLDLFNRLLKREASAAT